MRKSTRIPICVAAVSVIALWLLIWLGYPVRYDETATASSSRTDADGAANRSIAVKLADGADEALETHQMRSPATAGGPTHVAAIENVPELPERVLVEANRAQLLSAQREIRSFLQDLQAGNVSDSESKAKLTNWAEVLYRDALLAELTDGTSDAARKDQIRGELGAQQLSVDADRISAELPTGEEGYGAYLRQLLAEIVATQESVTQAIARDLTLRVDDLLQRRKRHSDNLFLPEIRAFVLNSGMPVNDRISYVEQFRISGDAALARYGAKLLADVPARETLSADERSAISRYQAGAAKETAQ